MMKKHNSRVTIIDISTLPEFSDKDIHSPQTLLPAVYANQ